ncbi:hypothetical protein J2S17_004815 [Cytobacillus purgationiresistens]|uniref:6-phosphogluconate dehydrogenase NADP-binding domain-containing protein n=1 Tax=Cytobacillus purgationiresistens TaxID=863449 RepID=A0ABU0ANQ4_9BACI|nr:hypothetical protein [Cytobacillus purgationiresistens]
MKKSTIIRFVGIGKMGAPLCSYSYSYRNLLEKTTYIFSTESKQGISFFSGARIGYTKANISINQTFD